jgi:hypothetical protein
MLHLIGHAAFTCRRLLCRCRTAAGRCAGQAAYREGNALVAQDKVEAGLLKYQRSRGRRSRPTPPTARPAARARRATNRLLTRPTA